MSKQHQIFSSSKKTRTAQNRKQRHKLKQADKQINLQKKSQNPVMLDAKRISEANKWIDENLPKSLSKSQRKYWLKEVLRQDVG